MSTTVVFKRTANSQRDRISAWLLHKYSRAYHLIRGGGSKALTFAHDVLRNPDLQLLLF
jgi:hypothetical protein